MAQAMAMIQRIGGDDLVQRVVGLFHSTAEERVRRLQELTAAGNLVEVGRVAHAMKGSAAQVGAEALRDASERLEHEGPTMAVEAVAAALGPLAGLVAEARAQLDACAAGGGEGA